MRFKRRGKNAIEKRRKDKACEVCMYVCTNHRARQSVSSDKKKAVNLHNYCSDDININMKWYILYIVYSTHLWRFQAVLTIIYLAKRLWSFVRLVMLCYVMLWLDYVRLGYVRFGWVLFDSVMFGYISFLYFITQKVKDFTLDFFRIAILWPIFAYNNEHRLKPSQMCWVHYA